MKDNIGPMERPRLATPQIMIQSATTKKHDNSFIRNDLFSTHLFSTHEKKSKICSSRETPSSVNVLVDICCCLHYKTTRENLNDNNKSATKSGICLVFSCAENDVPT